LNSIVCRRAGTCLRMRSTSGAKPMSSMRSASSSTAMRTPSRRTERRGGGGGGPPRGGPPGRGGCVLAGQRGVWGARRCEGPGGGGGEVRVGGEGERGGRAEPQGLGRRAVGIEALDHGDAERRRLAAARVGLADDVAAGERRGDRLRLDRRGGDKPHGAHRV